MTKSSGGNIKILRFNQELFLKSPHASNWASFFTDLINKGYDYNKRYGVIESTRIKDSSVFMTDLGLHKPESFMLLLVYEGDRSSIDESLRTPSKHIPIENVGMEVEPAINEDSVLGTIGGKLHEDSELGTGWELTGVVSFYRGVGRVLIERITSLAKEQGKSHLFCTVIYEHGLLDYYSKFGFVECQRRLLQTIDTETGMVQGGDLEDGICALRDFHIAFLSKRL